MRKIRVMRNHKRNSNINSSNQPRSCRNSSAFWEVIRTNIKTQHQAFPIEPVPRNLNLRLSFAQERLWFVEGLQPGSPIHNLRAVFQLKGPLDVAVLEKSLREIVRRHEILRTTFPAVHGQPVRFISKEADLKLEVLELGEIPAQNQEAEVSRLAAQEAQKPFDLAQGPLLRLKLLCLAEKDYVLLRTVHHIIYDRWSDSVFMRELAALYKAFSTGKPSPLPSLPIQYADFAHFQRQWFQSEEPTPQFDYWKKQLKGKLPTLQLPTDYSLSSVPTHRGGAQYLTLPRKLTEALKRLGSREGVSLFVILLAAFKALLYQYSGQEDIIVCLPIAGRNRIETRKLIGYFNNIVLLRTCLRDNPDFRELVRRLSKAVLGANQYQDLPVQQLMDSLNIPGAFLSRAMFAMENVPGRPLKLGPVSVTPINIEEGISNFDFFLSILEKGDRVTGALRYKTDLFKDSTITRMLENFQVLLNDIVVNPDRCLAELPRFKTAAPCQRQQVKKSKEAAYTAARLDIERKIAAVWQEVLQTKKISVHTNFFEAGGRSLSMIRIANKLQKLFDRDIPIIELFRYSTISGMARYLGQECNEEHAFPVRGKNRVNEPERQNTREAIAIIGMAGRFPGANNVDEFWQNLQKGVESITWFNDEDLLDSGLEPGLLGNPKYVRVHGILEDIEMFDASFFNMSPKEAALTDPQHRLFLECAWEALESAGYDSETYHGRIGVYAGAGLSSYLIRNLVCNRDLFKSLSNFEIAIGNNVDAVPMRVSYKLNLKGPSVSVNSTCSTSLVAIHIASRNLLDRQCDMVLAGGVFIRLPQKEGYLYQEGMIYSPDGRCRAFDARAAGTISGNGVGIVVLKRLQDAAADGDCIHAIIKGSAVSNDGAVKAGYTAPGVDGQAEAIAEAISLAGVDSDTISYIETHGTGTELGDPIEIAALTRAFRASTPDPRNLKNNSCALGSLKPNVGHLNQAAGVGGLIKTVLALKYKLLPPSLHFDKPNPRIDFANNPFFVNTVLRKWQTNGAPRRAGINSFGVGGTNAHVVLEETPGQEPSGKSGPWQLLVLSSKTSTALETAAANLARHLKQHPGINLADVAYTLQVGRRTFDYRRMLVCQQTDDAVSILERPGWKQGFTSCKEADVPPVVFMFPGQGAQYVNMARQLYEVEPTFQKQVDICAEILKPGLGLDLRHILYPTGAEAEGAAEQLQQTAITQPALFVIEYALAKLWMEWGVHPHSIVGHSIGEYTAACLADVFSLEDGLLLVAARGQMMQEMPRGKMLAVSLSPREVTPLLSKELSLSVNNTPSECVVSGKEEAVEAFREQLNETGVECRLLHTSHAFHSQMMDPIIAPFTGRIKQVNLKPPKIPFLSNTSGTWITAGEATDPHYWARHLRQTVRFADNLKQLVKEPRQILLEVGPGRTLSLLAKQHADKKPEQVTLTSVSHPQENPSDLKFFLTALGRLWLAGVKVDWPGFHRHERRYRLPLPTYPFERQRCWIDPPEQQPGSGSVSPPSPLTINEPFPPPSPNVSPDDAPRNLNERKIAEVWQEVLGIERVGIHDNFFDLGGNSLIAVRLVAGLCNALHTELSVKGFLTKPTIAELVELINTNAPTGEPAVIKDKQAHYSSLIKIKNGSSRHSALFLIHALAGHVYLSRDLAYCLDAKGPVYCFQAPGLEGEAEPFTEVEKMATRYIEEMRALQPNGPYFLGGPSFGGIVAFEMAQQLHAQGQKVSLLFLIDAPASGQILFNLDNDSDFLFFIVDKLLNLDREPFSLDNLRGLSIEEQVDFILARTKNRDQLPLGLDSFMLLQLIRVVKAHTRAFRSYSPRVYPGMFLFFRPRETWHNNMEYHPEYFWLDLARGGVEINTVPGNHITMNYQPHVRVMAGKLNLRIKQVEQGP